MKHKDEKKANQHDKRIKIVPLSILFILFCGFLFYLGGICCSEKDRVETKDVKKTVSAPKETSINLLQIKSTVFPECSSDYQDYTPCTDPRNVGHSLDGLQRGCTIEAEIIFKFDFSLHLNTVANSFI